MNKRESALGLAAGIAVCQMAGVVGAVFTTPAIPTWYRTLNKPSFTPPGWLFGPVWTALYGLMGTAAFLVWRQGANRPPVRAALGVFALQLSLNTLWSIVFFGRRSPLGGLAVILALWVAVMASIWHCGRISRAAGLLLVPYALWISFAAVLNLAIVRLNR